MLSSIFPGMGAYPIWLQALFFLAVGPMVVLLRYFAVAGSAYAIAMYTERTAPWRRIQKPRFTAKQIRREIGYSMMTSVVFALVLVTVFLMTRAGWTRVYSDADQYGMTWFWLQIPVVLAIQDFYFYWMHRTVHHPALYRRVHNVHHLSTNPSSFSAFAFHPLEAVLELGFIVPLAFVMPLTFQALSLVSLLSLIYNAYGHMGYEILPRWIGRSTVGRMMNTATCHNQHHKTYRYNFGLYSVIWDRLFGTLHPKSDALYDAVTTRPVAANTPREEHVQS